MIWHPELSPDRIWFIAAVFSTRWASILPRPRQLSRHRGQQNFQLIVLSLSYILSSPFIFKIWNKASNMCTLRENDKENISLFPFFTYSIISYFCNKNCIYIFFHIVFNFSFLCINKTNLTFIVYFFRYVPVSDT